MIPLSRLSTRKITQLTFKPQNMKSSKNETAVFLELSGYLTGFSEMELLGTGMLETYYDVAKNNNSIGVFESFLGKAAEIMRNKNDVEKINNAIGSELMPVFLFNGLAQNIITMWYMGNWTNGTVISPQSYIQGLIWTVADAHPPGAKQPGYGSWSKDPTKKL